jgi:hypothetical protein
LVGLIEHLAKPRLLSHRDVLFLAAQQLVPESAEKAALAI